MEIERKFLIRSLPENLNAMPSVLIEQAYICTSPVVRVRRQDDRFILTCKGDGMFSREECNLPMSAAAYFRMLTKAEGSVITKRRYLIPIENGLKIELDIFSGRLEGLVLAEVEFPDEQTALAFTPPDWFLKDVTFDPRYHNSWMSCHDPSEILPSEK